MSQQKGAQVRCRLIQPICSESPLRFLRCLLPRRHFYRAAADSDLTYSSLMISCIRFLASAIASSVWPSNTLRWINFSQGLDASLTMSLKWNVQGVSAIATAPAALISFGLSLKYLLFTRSVRDGKKLPFA